MGLKGPKGRRLNPAGCCSFKAMPRHCFNKVDGVYRWVISLAAQLVVAGRLGLNRSELFRLAECHSRTPGGPARLIGASCHVAALCQPLRRIMLAALGEKRRLRYQTWTSAESSNQSWSLVEIKTHQEETAAFQTCRQTRISLFCRRLKRITFSWDVTHDAVSWGQHSF